MQLVNGAQFLSITFLSTLFAAVAAAVFPTDIVPLASIYGSLYHINLTLTLKC